MRRLGATTRHVLGDVGSASIDRRRNRWAAALGDSRDSMTGGTKRLLGDLSNSIDVMTEISREVDRRPTNRRRLLALRAAAEDLKRSDPTGAALAIKTNDLRLADPLDE